MSTAVRILGDNEQAISIIAQQIIDERDSLAAIFAEDFIPLTLSSSSLERGDDATTDDDNNNENEKAISYAIRLVSKPLTLSSASSSRPWCRRGDKVEDAHNTGTTTTTTTSTTLLNKSNIHTTTDIVATANNDKSRQRPRAPPPNYELALGITYYYQPNYYPHHSMPIFHVHYCNTTDFTKLHSIQEEAILNCAINVVESSYQNNGQVDGIPCCCAYDCVLALQELIQRGGIDHACILFTLLSYRGEDCLAHILSYLISSAQDIDTICTSLPLIFCNESSSSSCCSSSSSVIKSNVIWRELCERRWRTRWGFEQRWRKYVDAFHYLRMQQQSLTSSSSSSSSKTTSTSSFPRTTTKHLCDIQYFWMHAYNYEESDALRTYLTRRELYSMTFDYRKWFSISSLRNQPENMRDVLPSGLRTSLAKDVIFLQAAAEEEETLATTTSLRSRLSSSPGGSISSSSAELSKLLWEGLTNNKDNTIHCTKDIGNIHEADDDDDDDGKILGLDLELSSSSSSLAVLESLVVGRSSDWGWELRGSNSIFRALDDGDKNSNLHHERKVKVEEDTKDNERRLSWEDLTTNMIIQERPGWITTNCRTRWETNYREIPDDEDCKMLDW